VTTERQHLGIHEGPQQLEADRVSASFAARETAVDQQCCLMHQAVGIVFHTIDATEWNCVTWNKLHAAKLLKSLLAPLAHNTDGALPSSRKIALLKQTQNYKVFFTTKNHFRALVLTTDARDYLAPRGGIDSRDALALA
jgi:hypothetical protein